MRHALAVMASGVLILLAAVPNVAADLPAVTTIAWDSLGDEPTFFVLPAGSSIIGRATPGGFEIVIAASSVAAPSAFSKDCGLFSDEDRQVAYVAENSNFPLRANDGLAGECERENHTGPIVWFEFRSIGDGSGSFRLDGDRGYLQIACVGSASMAGTGAPLTTPFSITNGDYSCAFEKIGASPVEYGEWTAEIRNGHPLGEVYAAVR